MNKFTPGPWVVAYQPSIGLTVKPAEDGDSICRIHTLRMDRDHDANAKLIAAAPDLLSALEAVIAIADRDTEVFINARAVIAKARGEPQ